MSEEKITMVSRIVDIASLKDIITGLLVIIGVIGGLYGSFKEESLAKTSHDNLAPVVDVASQVSENNSTELKEQSIRLRIMEEKFATIEMINILTISKGGNKVADLEELYQMFAKRYDKENPAKAHTRERIYEQKVRIKPRAKTYWEASPTK
jgi:hypothetical protein